MKKPSSYKIAFLKHEPECNKIFARMEDGGSTQILDIRGWGFLTGGASLDLTEGIAMKIQEGWGEQIAEAFNFVYAGKFQRGQHVRKIKGSSWVGVVVGFYSSSLTPEGYAVESEREPGSVQIYPAAALEAILNDDVAPGPNAYGIYEDKK